MDKAEQPDMFFCSICGKPVDLCTALTDDDGRTVHEECYALGKEQRESAAEPAA
jgi:hypothetical protein